jgi:transposase
VPKSVLRAPRRRSGGPGPGNPQAQGKGTELRFAYEAGTCGYQIYRHLPGRGYGCLVTAPALIPRRLGDRLKNDRRGALTLARLFRAGELTPVFPPADRQPSLPSWGILRISFPWP